MNQLVIYILSYSIPFSFLSDIDIYIIEAYRIIYVPRAVGSHPHECCRRINSRPRCKCNRYRVRLLLAEAVAALFGRI